jgi:hypothetical protein
MASLRDALVFVSAAFASLLPHRHWARLPASFPMTGAAFASGLATLFAGAGIGIPGFLAHAHQTTSLAIDGQLAKVFSEHARGTGGSRRAGSRRPDRHCLRRGHSRLRLRRRLVAPQAGLGARPGGFH